MGELICKALTLGYENNALIENLSFEVKKGDYLCIVGENGTGKSTLMRTILRLQKPMSGSIEYSDGLKSTEIGYLPQQTLVQRDFPASVKEVVISGCQAKTGIRPFYSKEEKALAAKNMERLGIDNLAKRCYRELSGGQQQRVLLARALCATEKMLLLDEPVSGLDPKVTADMYKMIKKLNDDGISIIMISHDIYSAVKYASHILHIGNDTFFGTVEEYRKTKLGKLYLDEEGGKDNA
ncbi:MAG: metal ABC transporter ATP-binding protein [Lachnospiraceae bacterium]|nr:metal ABC transporter ATP-binding protein [Lachnospiraceae bacterium]